MKSTTARISQFQTPKPAKKAKKPLHIVGLPNTPGTELRFVARCPGVALRAAGAGCPAAPFGLNASLVISASPASDPITADASSGIIRIFWFGDLAIASSAFT